MALNLTGQIDMKAKQQTDPNAAGNEVLRLLKEDGSANAELKDIRSAKATRKEQLKAALTVVWQAFEAKQTVNGCSTRKEWCQNFAKVTPRHCEHIIYGRKPSEANKRSLTLIKPGDIVLMDRGDGEGRQKFKIIDGGIHGVWLKKVEEEKPAPAKTPKKKKVEMYSTNVHPGFMTMPGKPHKTHKMNGKRTFCGKTPGDTLAKDARMSDEPTCRGCRTGEKKAQQEAKQKSAPAAQSRVLSFHVSEDGYRGVCGKLLKGYAGKSIQGNRVASSASPVNCPECIELLAKTQMHPAAQELAQAVAASSVPQHMKDRIESRKKRIALGLHPINDACPNAEEIVL